MSNQSDATMRRRQARRSFGPHATTYVFVNLLLFIVDAQAPGSWWFFWPLLIWGIGLANHAWLAFGSAEEDAQQPAHR